MVTPKWNPSQIRDGNRTTIPDSYRTPDYAPSGLRIVTIADPETQAGGSQSKKEKSA
jgi:hypothetical protein